MNIWYASVPVFFGTSGVAPTWLPGMLVTAPGGYAVEIADGVYRTFNPDGSYGQSSSIGSYETVTLDSALPILHVDSTVPNHPDMHLQIVWKAR